MNHLLIQFYEIINFKVKASIYVYNKQKQKSILVINYQLINIWIISASTETVSVILYHYVKQDL